MSIDTSWTALVDDPREVRDLLSVQSSDPDVTVFVPVHNEEDNIVTCLRTIGLAMQDTHQKVEVLCVNSACTDASPQLIEDCGVRMVESAKGVGPAWEAGIENTEGKHLLTTDADTRVPPKWIDAHMRHYEENGVSCVSAGYKYDKTHPIHAAYFGLKEQARKIILSSRLLSDRVLSGVTVAGFAGANMSWNNDLLGEEMSPNSLPDKHVDVVVGLMLESMGRVARDASPENMVLTSGRRYRTLSQATRAVSHNMMWILWQRILRKEKMLYGKTLKDIRGVNMED